MENIEISNIKSVLWSINSKKVVQIIHGAKEHIERYDSFARFLNSKGFDVVGHNIEGHGIFNKGNDIDFKEEDVLKSTIIVFDYLHLNYDEVFVFAHSMGSFILRNILKFNLDYKKVIFSGTGNSNFLILNLGRFLCFIHMKFFSKPSRFLNKLVFGNLENFLTHDKDLKNLYLDSLYCGQIFTSRSLFSLLSLVLKSQSGYNLYNKDIEYLNIYGEFDPIAKKNHDFVLRIKENHCNIVSIEYEGFYHEVLNEVDRQKVYSDILKFLVE